MRLLLLSLVLLGPISCGKNHSKTSPQKEVINKKESIKPKITGELAGDWISPCLTNGSEKFRFLKSFKDNNEYSVTKLIFNDEQCEDFTAMEVKGNGQYKIEKSSKENIWLLQIDFGNENKKFQPFQNLQGVVFFGELQSIFENINFQLDQQIPYHKAEQE